MEMSTKMPGLHCAAAVAPGDVIGDFPSEQATTLVWGW